MIPNTDGLRTQANELATEQNKLWERVQEIAFAEGGLSAEDREEFDTHNARLDEIDADIARINKVLAMQADKDEKSRKLEDLPAGVTDVTPSDEDRKAEEAAEYEAAFRSYMIGGMDNVSGEQRELLQANFVQVDQRAQATAPGSAGGFTIPEGFVNQIVEAMKAFGGLRNAPITQFTTASGNDLPVPTNDDTGNVGELLGENTQVTEQDLTFGQKVLKAYTWSSKLIRVSIQLLQDTAVDMDAFIAKKAGQRIGRAQAQYWVDGTGVDQPEGILTGIATEAAGAAATLAYDDFVNLEHAVDPAYRFAPDAHYVLSDDALKQTRLIKDLEDRPLWVPAMSGPFPATINGYAYSVDVNMPAVSTGETPIVFGALSHYWVRDVLAIQALRLTERYADFLQVGFIFFSRSDGRNVDAGDAPYKALEMA